MADDEFHEKLLNAANIGGDSDGRLLLHHIVSLLTTGNERGLTHGLLPKEYVNYLIDTLSRIIETPRNADKILKISKPKHREAEINLLHDGAIAYWCMKVINTHPKKAHDKIFGEISDKISEDHKDLLAFHTNQDEISLKSVERIYKNTYPIISQFKYIKGYEWILSKGSLLKEQTDTSIADAKNFLSLCDEIDECQINFDTLKLLPTSDESFYTQMAKLCINDIFNNHNT